MNRRILAPALKAGIALSLATLGIECAVYAYPPLMGVAHWLRSSPGSQCTAAETVRSLSYHRERELAEKQILQSARMIKRDGPFELWDVPAMGQLWIRGPFNRLNAFVLAEQTAGQYWHPSVHFQPGDIVLDVGADSGEVTLQALRAGAQKVVAIEIAPDKWSCLERTFAKEIAEGRVSLVRAGVWDSETTLELGSDSVVLERGREKRKVRVTTIDQIAAELQLPRVDFISMDIEGAEKPALRGAIKTLRAFRPRMAIASEHLPDDVDAIPQIVRAMVPGYEVICGQCNLVDHRLLAQVLWFK